MDYSNEFLLFGFITTMIGSLFVYKALKAHPIDFKSKDVGIIFLGPVPIVITGHRKWIITALGIFGLILLLMLIVNWRHDIISW